MKSSTQQKVSQRFKNCKYLPEISNSTTLTILTRDHKAVWKYSLKCQIYEPFRWNTEKLKFPTKALTYVDAVTSSSMISVTWLSVNNKNWCLQKKTKF